MSKPISFRILVVHDGKKLSAQVTRTMVNASAEFYTVCVDGRVFQLQNNWPVLRRHHLKKRKPTWKEQKTNNFYTPIIESITEKIEEYIQNLNHDTTH